MSKPRYKWWGYIKAVIRAYPELCRKAGELHDLPITANLTGMPKGGGTSRRTEETALRQLKPTEQRELDAVRDAIKTTERYVNGRDRLYVIDLVFWKRTHTLEGAAIRVPISRATAWRYHGDFIRLVAKYYGLME
jgi:hypothetical protein